ncbi:MAG: ATP-binding protein [Prevotella sp.]|jgi:energy-coupling factor transporter ATP-binding protein EcfA2|nr:ATP-binding protein [Prevotella sp.]
MILSALKYTRYSGEPREWSIIGRDDDYAYFGNMNLLAGKNASGKSRTLNVIREIANLLAGRINLKHAISPSGYCELLFTNENYSYKYTFAFKDKIVTDEVLSYNDEVILDRNKKIFIDTGNQKALSEVGDNELAVALSGAEGNPYYPDLVLWGQSLRNHMFANQMEKNQLVKDYTQSTKGPQYIEPVHTFFKGKKLFGEGFVSEIKAGMNELGYSVSDIDIRETAESYSLFIEEGGEYTVSQRDMSQGMFRALSLFIMLCYARMSDLSLCMLIDDMGEGLDFDRSQMIIDMVIKKINNSNMQFFMTSNDRHVMNHIPLKYWSVISRDHSRSIFYDYRNSKEIFDDFKYTGLNNFDFLATGFYKEGFGIIDDGNN